MQQRIAQVREACRAAGVDALLVMRPENRYYLTGFTGSAGAVVVTAREVHFLADFRYFDQAQQQCPHCRVSMFKDSLFEKLAGELSGWGVAGLGCEGDFLTYKQFATLQEKLGDIALKPLYGAVEKIRQVKDAGEVERLAWAVELADRAFEHIRDFLRPGATEREVALELEFFMRRQGAAKLAFDTILASGPRGAMPHGTATERVLQAGDLVTLDFGCTLDGYNSDTTRTVVIGRPPDARQQEIYRIVLEAQLAGINAVHAGVKACDADRATRDVIASYGYGDNFGHGTGHGVGLAVHEEPALSKRDETVLQPGMMVTVEPGIYLPGWGGVRIEDMVLVTEDGCRILTGAPKKQLLVCGRG